MTPRSTVPRLLPAIALTVQFMVALDASVVNVALAAIRGSLGFTPSNLTWVINAYALAFGGLIMLGGRVGDVVGHRRALLVGLALFGAASLAGGLAPDQGALIAARAAQGVGAALLAPIAFTLITRHVPAGPERTRALALWGIAAAAGGAVGVLAGGVLTQTAGWRSVLFVNVPVVLGAALAARRALPVDRRDGRPARLDLAGALLATAGTSLLVLGVIRAQTVGWGSLQALLIFALALVLLGLFAVVERRRSEPLLDLRLLTIRPVVAANLCVLLLFSGQFAAFYFVSLYLQQVLGYSPIATGTAFLPFCAGIVIGSALAGRILHRTGPRLPLALGSAFAAAGFCWFAAAMAAGGGFATAILGPSLVVSIGIGLSIAPVGTAATSGVTPAEAGMAASLITSSRQIGGSIGLAVMATVAITVTGRHGGTHAAALRAGYAGAVGASALLLACCAVIAALMLPGRRKQ
jgi:EmrB/QacA subfamily drug resistance transporter